MATKLNIDDFKAAFEGAARPTLYKVSGLGADRSIEFMVKAAQIPASTLGVIEVPHMGRKIKIAGDRTFEPWTITIINDGKFVLRKFFEDWSNRINHHSDNTGESNAESYKFDGYVTQLDEKGNTIAQYRLVGCWPAEVGAIELSKDSTDTLEEFTATLQYDYWERIG